MRLRPLIRDLLPPILRRLIEWLLVPPGFIYQPAGWPLDTAQASNWNLQSVAQAMSQRWRQTGPRLTGSAPLLLNPQSDGETPLDLLAHNIAITYGYALGLASRGRSSLSILDWGSGIGQYETIARLLLPGVDIRYHCRDLPLICEEGRKLLPGIPFYTSDAEFKGERFDVVLASGSLQYVQGWQDAAQTLTDATEGWLLITRLPVVVQSDSYVVLQNARAYKTHYPMWCLNRDAFVTAVERRRLRLVREFIVGEQVHVPRAPEQPRMRGFLFQRVST